MGVRKLSPGGYEYLTGSVACGDRELEPGESLSDYYLAHGYPPGEWLGRGAEAFGLTGDVTTRQMNALFGEGRHPHADRIEARMIAAGSSADDALKATKLGNRFIQFSGPDQLRCKVIDAYKAHNLKHGRPIGAPIADDVRARIRRAVQADSYAEQHDGQRPTDTELKRWLAEQKREVKTATSGYELVFAPPKSVSVAWALSDQDSRELIVNLHRQAVRDAVTYLENNAAYTRKGAGGYTQHDVNGITGAAFEHWDSRSGDPHLHTHVPISAKVQGPDGKWTSLDGRTILAASVTVSEYYDSCLRDAFREHGARWADRPRGGFDVKRMGWELDGVPDELLAGFSQRASQVEQQRAARIVAFRHEHGREPEPPELREISRQSKYDARAGKQQPRTLTEHVRRWRDHAESTAGNKVVRSLGNRVFGGSAEQVSQPDTEQLAARTLAVVSDHYAHFNKWNIIAEAHRQSAHLRVPAGTRDQLINKVVDAVIASSDTIELHAPPLVDEPAELHRASGESVFAEHNAQRWTTHQTLREESALAAWGRRSDGVRISGHAVHHALAGTRLNAGQRRAVTGFAQSGRRVQLLYAPAGTGKTTLMRTFAEAWRAEAGRVFAFGPSARAAQELGEAISASGHTLHQLTTAQQTGVAGRVFGFARGDVVIIDEVAMAGTHTLHDVVEYALRCSADVRLIGDDKQLSAVEAGGAMRWFEHRNGCLRLHEVLRFSDRGQAAASLKIRDGDATGLDYYFGRNWVTGGSRETMRDAAHHAWRADLDQGRETLLIVPAQDDVVALNLQARQLRQDRGDVDGSHQVQLHDGTAASTGDWIVTRHNDRLTTLFGGKDFVKNGDVWELKTVRRDGALKIRHRTSGGTVVLPADYVASHVELAYASTVNRCQGMSVTGSAHGLIPQGISREQLYTLITRAAHDNRLYVETHQHTIDSHQETPPEHTARAVLETALSRSSAETSATEELRTSLATAESLRTLAGRYDYVAHLGADDRIDTILTTHAPALLDLPATPALRQTLRNAEDLGWQTHRLVPAALAEGSLDAASDPAAVLQWRISQRIITKKPPERTITAPESAICHWRGLIQHHAPAAAVEDAAWQPVWHHLASATDDGLDTTAAVTLAAQRLATRPAADPASDHDFTSQILAMEFARQRQHGAGWQPVLPWLTRPDHLALTTSEADFLQRLEKAISNRTAELRAQVASDPPAWITILGPRPGNPAAAQQWDHLAGLAAAYRDTYTITDPLLPLGEQPDGEGLRTRAWHEITSQWNNFSEDSSSSTAAQSDGPGDSITQLREEFGTDDILSSIDETETISATGKEEPLDVLLEQYQRASQELILRDLTARAQEALAEHAPHIIGQPSEAALLNTLRRAENLGWQAERLLPQAIHQRSLHHTSDPAEVLRWRIEQHLTHRQPPAPAIEASPRQVAQWQALAAEIAPHTDTSTWNLVWRHAAAGTRDGLDTDAAITAAARHIAGQPSGDAADNRQHAAQELVDHLTWQRQQGAGWQPLLPWMPRPHYTEISGDSELADHIRRISNAIQGRLAELRNTVSREQPAWTTGLGPRPQQPETAEQWDNLAELAAAYRETYGVTTTNPKTPLGPSPGETGAKAQAWHTITQQWRPVMNQQSSYQRDDNQHQLDALRDQIDELRQDHLDEHLEARDDRHDEDINRSSDYDDDHNLGNSNEFHTGLGM